MRSMGAVQTASFNVYEKTEGGVTQSRMHRGGLRQARLLTTTCGPLQMALECRTDTQSCFALQASGKNYRFVTPPISDLQRFVTVVHSMSASPPSLYEILLENEPCATYVDIDHRDAAPTVAGMCARLNQTHIDRFCACVLELLCLWWPHLANVGDVRARADVCIAHGVQKFSVHAVVRITVGDFHVLWPSASALLTFITELKKKWGEDDVIGWLVNAIDASVYTRNRYFRCLGSCKYGDTQRPLTPAFGSATSTAGHFILGINSYGPRLSDVHILKMDDIAPEAGYEMVVAHTGGVALQPLPPQFQRVMDALRSWTGVRHITWWQAVGVVGGVLHFTSTHAAPCALFPSPRPHKSNGLRYTFSWGQQEEPQLEQYCHDTEHCRWPTRQAAAAAQWQGKLAPVLSFTPVHGWDNQLRASFVVPYTQWPAELRAACTFTPVRFRTALSAWRVKRARSNE
jgi:hypothetical protein